MWQLLIVITIKQEFATPPYNQNTNTCIWRQAYEIVQGVNSSLDRHIKTGVLSYIGGRVWGMGISNPEAQASPQHSDHIKFQPIYPWNQWNTVGTEFFYHNSVTMGILLL